MGKRKAASTTSDANNLNQDICDLLIELAQYERDVGKNIYKYNAYRKAAGTLGALPEKVRNGKEAKKFPGIGDKIAKKIDEFLQTGKLQKLENIKEDDNVANDSSTQESGESSAKVKKLVDAGETKKKKGLKKQGKSTKKSSN